MRLPLLATTLAAAALFAGAPLAHELDTAEKRVIPYAANLPLCGDPSVLARVANNFAEKEEQFWRSDRAIVEFERIQPVAWRPWGLDLIPRRFCTATAVISDGRRSRVDYSVREDLAFLGNGWGVEFCVTGLDRNWAFSPACRMARP